MLLLFTVSFTNQSGSPSPMIIKFENNNKNCIVPIIFDHWKRMRREERTEGLREEERRGEGI